MTDPLRLLAFRVMDTGVDHHFFHKVQTEGHEIPLTLNGENLGHPDIFVAVTAGGVSIGVDAYGDIQAMTPKGGPGVCRTAHSIRDPAGNIQELKPGPVVVHYDNVDGALILLLRHTHGIVALVVYPGPLGHPHTTRHLLELNHFICQTYGQDALAGWDPMFPLKLMRDLLLAVHEYGQGFGDEVEDTFDQ